MVKDEEVDVMVRVPGVEWGGVGVGVDVEPSEAVVVLLVRGGDVLVLLTPVDVYG